MGPLLAAVVHGRPIPAGIMPCDPNRIDGHIVAIYDIEALAALADFEKGYLSQFRIGELLAPG